MDPDTGVYDKKVNADLVITFHDIKQGMMKIKEKTIIADIGIKK
jgi:NAD(P)H-hydrate repair Nnr-like enzyme with NAD(P)H-hydrate epimerase domain